MPIMQTRHLLFFPALAGLKLFHGLMSSEQHKARPVPVTQGSALIWESGRGLRAEPQAEVIPAGIWTPSKLTHSRPQLHPSLVFYRRSPPLFFFLCQLN